MQQNKEEIRILSIANTLGVIKVCTFYKRISTAIASRAAEIVDGGEW